MVHAGEENLPSTTVFGFLGPFQQSSVGTFPSAFHIAMPSILVQPSINGADADLRTELASDLIDEVGVAESGGVDATGY